MNENETNLDASLASGDVQAAIDAGIAIAEPHIIEIDGNQALVRQEGQVVESLEHMKARPSRITAKRSVTTVESFIDYFNAFADDTSAIFCDVDSGSFIGIIDHHADQKPAWCGHTVTFTCTPTPEWKEWRGKNGIKMCQEDFALFIESMADEIVVPPSAEMLEIATSLKTKTKVSWGSSKRLADGQTQFQYIEEQEGRAGPKGQLNIPETIKLGMRIFDGGDAYALEARFRYRVNNGQLTMWYDLVRPEKVHRAAVNDTFEQIRKHAKCQLIIHGAP